MSEPSSAEQTPWLQVTRIPFRVYLPEAVPTAVQVKSHGAPRDDVVGAGVVVAGGALVASSHQPSATFALIQSR